jgi:hypothetical protein
MNEDLKGFSGFWDHYCFSIFPGCREVTGLDAVVVYGGQFFDGVAGKFF